MDASIILQAGKGVTPLLTPDEIQASRAQREMQGLQLQQARQGIADDQAYRQVLQSGAQGGDQVTALQRAGLGKHAMEAQKFQGEQQKTAYERGKAVTDAMKVGAQAVMQNPTEQFAIQTLDDLASRYGVPAHHFDAGKAAIYAARNDPNKIRTLMGGLGAKVDEALGKIENQNLGGVNSIQRTNPYSGETQVLGTQARTQSPDSVASVAQSASNAAMTDARARELNSTRARGNLPSGYEADPDKPGALRPIAGGPADPLTKPAGGKPLNDTQSKALQFGSRMQEANDLFESLAAGPKGADRPGAIKRSADTIPDWAFGKVASAAANYTQSPKQQQVEQAQRDFVNAVLRRESGAAISASEFDNAQKQYFPSANDTPEVIAQKKQNREIATRGILAEVPESESRVAQVRGKRPGEQPGASAPGADPAKPKTKAVTVAGRDFMAELSPVDGKYYVQQNGRWSRVKE